MTRLLFIYDDLLTGRPDDGLLAAFPHRAATMAGHLHRLPNGRPVLVVDPEGPAIAGELVQLPGPEPLAVLDLLNGVRDGPVLREILPAMARGARRPAWVYTVSAKRARLLRLPALRTTDWRLVAPGGSW